MKDYRINSDTQLIALALRRFKISLFSNINRSQLFKLLVHLVLCKPEHTQLKAWYHLQVTQRKHKPKQANQGSTLHQQRKQLVLQPRALQLNANKLKTERQLFKI